MHPVVQTVAYDKDVQYIEPTIGHLDVMHTAAGLVQQGADVDRHRPPTPAASASTGHT